VDCAEVWLASFYDMSYTDMIDEMSGEADDV